MLDSPQTITVNAIAIDCNKTQDEKTSSLYASDDGTLEFRVSHQAVKNRTRRMARIDQTKIAADPLTAINAYQKAGVYIVIDEPDVGFSNTEIDYLVDALSAWLTSGNITAMLAGRH